MVAAAGPLFGCAEVEGPGVTVGRKAGLGVRKLDGAMTGPIVARVGTVVDAGTGALSVGTIVCPENG